MHRERIAIIGAGVTGLSAAWLLHNEFDVTLFEKNDYIGGHTHTIDVETDEGQLAVDTGFIVYNEKNYPNLMGLFKELQIGTQATDMSFAFSLDQGETEYCGSGLSGLFGQRSNWLNPRHWMLLKEIVRFNKIAHQSLKAKSLSAELSLGEFLHTHRFSSDLQKRYLLPMGAAIWSCPVETMLQFPVHSFLQFFKNHGLINLRNRPQWRTVSGGSQQYVKKMLQLMANKIRLQPGATRVSRSAEEVIVNTADGIKSFDHVIFACHADQALALLQDPTVDEEELLGKFRYEINHTYLHTDIRLMPRRKAVWSSWNYLAQSPPQSRQQMTATYWMNRLQNLDTARDYLVTLNPYELPREEHIIAEMKYEHPVFDQQAAAAQEKLAMIQGKHKAWFCGSYSRYGFHEDALMSAVNVCKDFGVSPAWETTTPTRAGNGKYDPLGRPAVVTS